MVIAKGTKTQWLAVLGLILGCLLCLGALQTTPAFADTGNATDSVPAKATLKGWQKEGKNKVYYKAGEKLTGMQKIGKNYYFFSKKGVMKTGTVKDGDRTYYLNDKGAMEAYKVKSTFYKPTGKKMQSYEAKEYKTLLKARQIASSITKKSMSKSQKLLACFKWVQKGYYHQYRRFSNYAGWAADFANDHFERKYRGLRHGCCVSDAAAFGYLAVAVGYDKVYVGMDTKTGTGGHGCTKIGDKYYDPLFAEAKSFSKYYGGRNAGYHFRSVQILVPSASNGYATSKYIGQQPTGLASAKSKKAGLVKEKAGYVYYKNGKKVTSKFIKVGKSTYYFKANGVAATGPQKVKKTNYVFSASGKLLTGAKTRTVKVSGDTYRVNKKGVAKPGWTSNKKSLYLENGRKATGLSRYKGKIYCFTSKGAYDANLTKQVRAAAKPDSDATALLALLGKPVKTSRAAACNPVVVEGDLVYGDEVTYTYKNCKIVLLDGENGIRYFRNFA